jgi:hypothetical protein
VQRLFFDPDRGPYEQVTSVRGGEGWPTRWWRQAYAHVRASIDMPPWTRGWLWAGNTAWGADTTEGYRGIDGRGQFHGGTGSPYYDEGHVVLMRTKHSDRRSYFRNWDGRDLADPLTPRWLWRLIPPEPWPADFEDVSRPRHDGPEYDRHRQYVIWSE